MSTIQVKRWRIYCNTEARYVDGYLNRDEGSPTTCFNNNTHTIDIVKTTLVENIENNYTKSVIKWKVYCATELAYVEGYTNGDMGTPTKCFNNNSHVATLPEKLEHIENEKVLINEESVPGQGCFKSESIKLSMAPNQVLVFDKTWPFDISPLAVTALCNEKHSGDSLQVDVSPNRTIGVLTADCNIGDTEITVSSTVIQYIKTGFLCKITDGVNISDLGLVINVDYKLNQISVETPLTSAFLASSPTYINMSVRFLGPHDLGGRPFTIGSTKIGASFVPKNEIVRMTYTNKSPSYKDLYILLEFLY